jgi:hypothetical protein
MSTKTKAKKSTALLASDLTREQWLVNATKAMRPWFEEQGKPLPEKVQLSAGIPKGSRNAIGQCWDAACTPDGTWHIFISPSLGDPVLVLATLLHELCHAALGGSKVSHGPEFKKLAMKQFGLTGRATATVCEPGTPLHAQLVLLAEKLGSYPHSVLTVPRKGSGGSKGWVRLESRNEPTYTVVISKKNINEHGWPTDPWGERMKLQGAEDEPEAEGEEG